VLQKIHDKSVTIASKFPFLGGSLSGERDILARRADSLLRSQFSSCWVTVTIDWRLDWVVDTSKISKCTDKYITRKLWVAH